MGKKQAVIEVAPVLTVEDLAAALVIEQREKLFGIAKADGQNSSGASGSRAEAGELLRELNFIPSDERTEGSGSALLKESLRKSYFEGYAVGRDAQQAAWLAANSVKGLDAGVKVEADKLLESCRAAWGMFFKAAKKAGGLVTIQAARPVGGAVEAEGAEGAEGAAVSGDPKWNAAVLLADGDLVLAEWVLWGASAGRGHLKAAYAAFVPA